ncbi:MAG: ABC transporter ATP-binding protein [Rhodospirillales bacterium]|nr:ABC transporter ATP-binding protein [Rhodospirillales bacterium]
MADSSHQPDGIAIAARDLEKRFENVTAVGGISFDVRLGSVTALLGGNGAGKTTTIAMLLGLLVPTGGTIYVLGTDILADRHTALPRMNFSSPYVDMPHRLSVYENLLVYANLYGVSEPRDRVRELARDLELEAFLNRPLGKASAGQKTRAALAKALINQPDLLLLDEPTASLDPDTADWVRGYLDDYRRRTGATIVLASHNMAEIERLCDHVLIMKEGRIADRGAPEELSARYGRQNLEEVFLEIARSRNRAGAAR